MEWEAASSWALGQGPSVACSGKADARYWPALSQATLEVIEERKGAGEGEEEESLYCFRSSCTRWEWANPSDPCLRDSVARFSK